MKVSIAEAIVVEGKYDVNTVKQVVDTLVIATDGFQIFQNAEKLQWIRKVAQERGLILLTDSDSAGFLIRNYLRGVVDVSRVKHAYIPPIEGKERRKAQRAKEGLLGVEGMKRDIVLDALHKAGATFLDAPKGRTDDSDQTPITKADLFAWGLMGTNESKAKRQAIYQKMGLPSYLSTNAFLEYVNAQKDKQTLKEQIQTWLC